MTSFNDALKRLTIIQVACSPQVKGNTDEVDLDEFTRLKRFMNVEIKRVRETLNERDDLLKAGRAMKEVAEMSARIRTAIKKLKDEVRALENAQQSEQKKEEGRSEKKKVLTAQQLSDRAELVQLAWRHIEELEAMEKKRFLTGFAEDENRSKLLGGGALRSEAGISTSVATGGGASTTYRTGAGGGGGGGNGGGGVGAFNTSLPDLDVADDMKQIQNTNRLIDQDLDLIAGQLSQVKELAIVMGTELENQSDMIDELEKKVDRAAEKMDNVNVTMKRVVEKMMKGDKFMVNCVLICIILAMVGYIISKVA